MIKVGQFYSFLHLGECCYGVVVRIKAQDNLVSIKQLFLKKKDPSLTRATISNAYELYLKDIPELLPGNNDLLIIKILDLHILRPILVLYTEWFVDQHLVFRPGMTDVFVVRQVNEQWKHWIPYPVKFGSRNIVSTGKGVNVEDREHIMLSLFRFRMTFSHQTLQAIKRTNGKKNKVQVDVPLERSVFQLFMDLYCGAGAVGLNRTVSHRTVVVNDDGICPRYIKSTENLWALDTPSRLEGCFGMTTIYIYFNYKILITHSSCLLCYLLKVLVGLPTHSSLNIIHMDHYEMHILVVYPR